MTYYATTPRLSGGRAATIPLPCSAPAPDPTISVDASDLPARPPQRPGYVCELGLDRGAWIWRYRRPDRADAAYAQYRARQVHGVTP